MLPTKTQAAVAAGVIIAVAAVNYMLPHETQKVKDTVASVLKQILDTMETSRSMTLNVVATIVREEDHIVNKTMVIASILLIGPTLESIKLVEAAAVKLKPLADAVKPTVTFIAKRKNAGDKKVVQLAVTILCSLMKKSQSTLKLGSHLESFYKTTKEETSKPIYLLANLVALTFFAKSVFLSLNFKLNS